MIKVVEKVNMERLSILYEMEWNRASKCVSDRETMCKSWSDSRKAISVSTSKIPFREVLAIA